MIIESVKCVKPPQSEARLGKINEQCPEVRVFSISSSTHLILRPGSRTSSPRKKHEYVVGTFNIWPKIHPSSAMRCRVNDNCFRIERHNHALSYEILLLLTSNKNKFFAQFCCCCCCCCCCWPLNSKVWSLWFFFGRFLVTSTLIYLTMAFFQPS